MISAQKRKAAYTLYQEGVGIRKISKSLKISVNSVRKIITEKGEMPDTVRKDKIEPEPELIEKLYRECNGYVQRVHELLEERGIAIGYSTLTRLVRDMEIGKPAKERSGRHPDEPGEEMQHDTSEYYVCFNGSKDKVKVIASILYLRYSKMRYLKFYRTFNRFVMKCFFHEALSYWGYCAPLCIIDNTNLARLYGTGKNAVIVPEMEKFSENYGFKFECHELNHSDRKAGNERSFYTTQTNFFPGRRFDSLEDMNDQAFEWATKRMFNRPLTKSRIIPSIAFDYEKGFLNRLPDYVRAPYIVHERQTDQYGYISFAGNYYWVPGVSRNKLTVLQCCNHIVLYHLKKRLVEYKLPPFGISNEMFTPPDGPKPKYQPHSRKKTTHREEKVLRGISENISNYLDYALSMKGKGKAGHTFIRKLYILHLRTVPSLLEKTLNRAKQYKIADINTIERILAIMMQESNYEALPVEIDWDYKNREAFTEGRHTGHTDLAKYNKYLEDNDG